MEAPIKVDILRSEGEATTAPREAHRGKINCEPISLTTSRLMAAGSTCALLIVLCVPATGFVQRSYSDLEPRCGGFVQCSYADLELERRL